MVIQLSFSLGYSPAGHWNCIWPKAFSVACPVPLQTRWILSVNIQRFRNSASCACENLQMPEECWGLINIPIITTLIISPRCFYDCPFKECLSKFYLHLFSNIDAQWINAVHGCQCWRLIKSMCEPDALIEKSAATKLGLNKHFTVVL